MTRAEILAAREAALTNARSLIEQITPETTEERAQELEAQHDAAMGEFDRREAQLARHDRLVAADERMENSARSAHDNANDRQRPQGSQRSEDPDAEQNATYDDAFYGMLRHGGDATQLSTELRSALLEGSADMTVEERQQLTTTGVAGGFLVPTELQAGIITAMALNGPMYDGTFINEINSTNGAKWTFPTVDDLTMDLDELPEGTEVIYDAGKAFVFGEKDLGAYMYDSKFVKISLALLTDSREAVETVAGGLLGERAGRTANKVLTLGDGNNKPQGILTGAVTGHTSAVAGSLVPDDFIDLEHSVNGAYRQAPKSAFQMNDNTLKAVRKFKDADGNYIWQAANMVTGAPAKFLGYNFRVNPDMPDIGAGNSPVIFGDHGKYYVRKVGGLIVGLAREKFWPNLGMAVISRFDGRLMDARAIKKLDVQ